MKVNKSLFLLLFVLLGISIAVNFFLFQSLQGDSAFSQNPTDNRGKYPFLSLKVLNPDYDSDLINNFLPLRQQLQAMSEPYKDDIALYFEYLPTGTSVGVNEDALFTAASLLKVPVVMAYFRQKERLGITEDADVTIKQENLNDAFGEVYKRGAGATLNLGEAVKFTLQESDNTASFVLADHITEEDFNYVYEGLDIEPALEDNRPIITAQQYASVLKSLYFSSVLSKDNSQYILDLLTKTEFNNMLPSGVPKGVPIAHKIGLIDEQIYSDCGIVYVPKRPYLLCVISKSDRMTSRQRVHDISKATYDYVAGYKLK